MLPEEVVEKFNSINLLERFKVISETFQTDAPLENYSKDSVVQLFEHLDFDFKYDKKGAFFGTKSIESGYDFRFNLVLKYGIVEIIMWAKNIETGEQYGGVFSRLMKSIQKCNGVIEIVKIGYPRFSSYDELEEIVGELMLIYEDFKVVLKSTA